MTPRRTALALAAILAATGAAAAEDWPSRPVTMVIPFAAGGPTDAVGRVVALGLGETLGQQVVVENVGGAGGMTGAGRVAHGPADGSVFLFGGASSQVFNQLIYKKPLYNARTDFSPVALLTEQASVLIARKDLPASSLPEFIGWLKGAKAASFGSAGVGSTTHLGCLLLDGAIGAEATHVPYRGAALAMQDLLAGRIDYMCDLVPDAVGHIRSGDVKAIAVLAPARSPILPEVATAEEQGLRGVDANSWYGLFLPKGAPAAIVQRLADAASVAVDTGAVRERLRGLGVDVVARERRGADYLARLIGEEHTKWAVPIRASGITVD